VLSKSLFWPVDARRFSRSNSQSRRSRPFKWLKSALQNPIVSISTSRTSATNHSSDFAYGLLQSKREKNATPNALLIRDHRAYICLSRLCQQLRFMRCFESVNFSTWGITRERMFWTFRFTNSPQDREREGKELTCAFNINLRVFRKKSRFGRRARARARS